MERKGKRINLVQQSSKISNNVYLFYWFKIKCYVILFVWKKNKEALYNSKFIINVNNYVLIKLIIIKCFHKELNPSI